MPAKTWLAAPLCALILALSASAQEAPSQAPSSDPRPPLDETSDDAKPLSFKRLPKVILKDQQFLWTRPFRFDRKSTAWTIALVGTTAGFAAGADHRVAQELADDPPGTGRAFSQQVGRFSGGLADAGVAGTFFLVGKWRNDRRAQETGLLGFRAVADSMIVVHTLKAVTQRPRPAYNNGLPNQEAEGEFFEGGHSFPSGHAAQAWALATVVAHQYRHRRWVPIAAYGLAGFVAGCRVTSRRHFPSDVLVGSALGYLIGRHVVSDPSGNGRSWKLVPQPAPGGGAAVGLFWEF